MGDLRDLDEHRRKRNQQNPIRVRADGPTAYLTTGTPSTNTRCANGMHWFDRTPGPCKCGQSHWHPDNTITEGA